MRSGWNRGRALRRRAHRLAVGSRYPPKGWIEGYAQLGATAGWRWRCRADFGFRDGRIEQLADDVWEWADATKCRTFGKLPTSLSEECPSDRISPLPWYSDLESQRMSRADLSDFLPATLAHGAGDVALVTPLLPNVPPCSNVGVWLAKRGSQSGRARQCVDHVGVPARRGRG